MQMPGSDSEYDVEYYEEEYQSSVGNGRRLTESDKSALDKLTMSDTQKLAKVAKDLQNMQQKKGGRQSQKEQVDSYLSSFNESKASKIERRLNQSSELDIDKILNNNSNKDQKKPKKLGSVMVDEPDNRDPNKETIDIVCSPLNMSKKLQT